MCKELINKRFINIVNSVLESKKASSKADICQKFRISPQKFSEILKERMNVGTDLLAYVAELYPEYSLRWLLTGEGSMLKSDVSVPIGAQECEAERPSNALETSTSSVILELVEQIKQLTAENALLKAELDRRQIAVQDASTGCSARAV